MCEEVWEIKMDEHQEVTEGPCKKETCVINSAVQEGWRNDEWARGSKDDVA